MRSLRVLGVAGAALFLAATQLLAQTQSGEIIGRVTDSTGAALAGVTVTIESPALLRPQTAISTRTGAYRFANVPIGAYAVRFELTGFRGLVREGIRIEVGFNAEVNAKLEISSVQETLTVTGESPVIDTKRVSTGGNFDREMLELLPSARDPWEMLKMTPGLVMTGNNVGGNMSGQQVGYAAHGGGQRNSMWNVDGAQITDMSATGSSLMYYDFDSFQEIQIVTGGSDASIQTGGVNLNLITKSGGNAFKGSGRFFLVDDGMQANNVDKALFDQGAGSGNPLKNIKDYGFEMGGPIVRNKLWFWAGYGKQDIKVGVVGFYKKTPECSPPPGTFDRLEANQDCLETDLSVLETYNGKLQYQPAKAHKLTFSFTWADKIRNARDAGPLRPIETTYRQTGPVPTFNLKHNWFLNDRLTLETTGVYAGGGFVLDFHEDSLANVQRKLNITTGLNSRSNQRQDFDRPITELRTDGNYFLSNVAGGDHAFKLGVRWKDSPAMSSAHIGGNATARYQTNAAGQEVPIEAELHRDSFSQTAQAVASAYLSDQYTRGRLTLTLGARFDYQDDRLDPATVPANPLIPALLPAVTFAGADAGVTYRDFSPRLSAAFDLRGNGKTVAKASVARYFGQAIAASGILNPVNAVTLRYAWSDPNGDQIVQASELGSRLTIAGNYDPANPASPTTQNSVDPNLRNDRTDEVIVGIDHELLRDFAVGLSYIHRRYDQFNRDDRPGISPSDFVRVGYTETDARFAARTPAISYYQLLPGLTRPQVFRRQNDTFYRRYNGLELTAKKRMSNRWMMNGSFNWQRALQYYPDGSYDEPTDIEFLNGQPGSPSDTRWLAKLGGGYTFPWRINASLYVNGRDGFLRNEVVQTPNRPGGLGRADVRFEPQGRTRYPSVWTADAHAEKWVSVGKARFAVNFDGFNLGNVNTLSSQGNRRNDTNYGRVLGILAPRVLRLGVRFNF